MLGIVLYVLNLKMKYIKDQISLFFWSHLIIIYQSFVFSAVVVLYNGMIWFLLGICLIIINDSMAYVVGKLFGRTPLIKLSPKKTVEGFIGGLIFTFIIGLTIGYLASFDWMEPFLCPQYSLTFKPFSYPTCEIPKLFEARPIDLRIFNGFIGPIVCSEFQIHIIFLAIFASIIAPFGGFFASGIKRAL